MKVRQSILTSDSHVQILRIDRTKFSLLKAETDRPVCGWTCLELKKNPHFRWSMLVDYQVFWPFEQGCAAQYT